MQFKCSTKAYQFAGIPSRVYEINLVTGTVTYIKTLPVYINAIGYNPIDNYIYGYENSPIFSIVRIDSNYNYVSVPIPNLTGGFVAGCFDTAGYYYLGDASNKMHVVDLNPNRATYGKLVDSINGYQEILSPPYYVTLSAGTALYDWGWIQPLQSICGLILYDGRLRCVNPVTGLVTTLPTTGAVPGLGGAITTFINGEMYSPTNETYQVLRITTDGVTANVEQFTTTNVAFAQNDATNCLMASMQIDFGDAPDISSGNGPGDYTTSLINNGPRHELTDGLTLGTAITSELDAYQNPTATGDDIIKGVQDDSVDLPIKLMLVGSSKYAIDARYTNSIGLDANIYGWIDFNRDGIFQLNEASDNLFVSSATTNPRVATLNFTVPDGVILVDGDDTFMRIRITTDHLINTNNDLTMVDTRSIGPASNGEIEDFQIKIISLKISGTVWYDKNCNGLRDIGETPMEGVTVELYKITDLTTPLAVTTTDSNGNYEFKDLLEGQYVVKVIAPNGYVYTLTNVGINNLIDSDINKNSGFSSAIGLSQNNPSVIIDSGLCNCKKISGQTFYDCKNDGLLDYKDSYLCGVTVQLRNSSNIVIDSMITDCDGYYEFDHVCPGDYTVEVIAPPGMNVTIQNTVDFYGSKPSTTTSSFPVTIVSSDYIQGFAGFKGNSTLDKCYCINRTCNPKLTDNCNGIYHPNQCSDCSGTCQGCKNGCAGTCYGCTTCRPSNRSRGQSCSSCTNSGCDCCNKK
ncbi:MAG: SdrD B-like domain-containing protein [Clostridium sp.]|uniref:SdrD B-like domain-containing protein n=1 Tax=Anaerorhabdus sp. TaxID=1872524 RepID=UPI002FCB6547